MGPSVLSGFLDIFEVDMYVKLFGTSFQYSGTIFECLSCQVALIDQLEIVRTRFLMILRLQ